MFGRLGNVGAPTEVPKSAWAGIQIIDDHQHGVIAAPTDRHRPGVAWWGGLTLKREEVQQLWAEDGATEKTRAERRVAPRSEETHRT